jgi:hypothetical protein
MGRFRKRPDPANNMSASSLPAGQEWRYLASPLYILLVIKHDLVIFARNFG